MKKNQKHSNELLPALVGKLSELNRLLARHDCNQITGISFDQQTLMVLRSQDQFNNYFDINMLSKEYCIAGIPIDIR